MTKMMMVDARGLTGYADRRDLKDELFSSVSPSRLRQMIDEWKDECETAHVLYDIPEDTLYVWGYADYRICHSWVSEKLGYHEELRGALLFNKPVGGATLFECWHGNVTWGHRYDPESPGAKALPAVIEKLMNYGALRGDAKVGWLRYRPEDQIAANARELLP